MEPLAAQEAEFFGLDGNPVTYNEWAYMFRRDPLRLTSKTNGYLVLTTWLGVDMPDPMSMLGNRYGWRNWEPNESPMIYRSVVFNPDLQMIEAFVYPTEDEAYEGHAQLTEKYENEA